MLALAVPGLALAACTARPASVPPTVVIEVKSPPLTATQIPTPKPSPTPPPKVAPALTPTASPAPEITVADFGDIPGNVANGEPAPDFTARVVGGTFTLSEHRGSFVLVFPTIVGCGDCVFTMEEIAAAYPDYRGRGIKVVILNLYPGDTPESWQPFIEYVGEPEFIWGVVGSENFAVDYNLATLGTIVFVDPEGKVAFRSDYPVVVDGFRQLFNLATR
ncbi:MAG: redoxin domain-containing protein [Chloroflexi bacterium]|nr:redoxin domain-containing protein [Chloroflexota bacterium]